MKIPSLLMGYIDQTIVTECLRQPRIISWSLVILHYNNVLINVSICKIWLAMIPKFFSIFYFWKFAHGVAHFMFSIKLFFAILHLPDANLDAFMKFDWKITRSLETKLGTKLSWVHWRDSNWKPSNSELRLYPPVSPLLLLIM